LIKNLVVPDSILQMHFSLRIVTSGFHFRTILADKVVLY